MARAPGPSRADRMTIGDGLPCLQEIAWLLCDLHQPSVTGLPSLKARLAGNIRRTDHLDEDSRRRLLWQLGALPDGDRPCHGDFHPWNIHGEAGEVMILDWLDTCAGPPAADVCRIYVLIHHADPATASGYVDASVRLTGLPTADIMVWLPPTAAARLAEGGPAETGSLLRLAGQTPADG